MKGQCSLVCMSLRESGDGSICCDEVWEDAVQDVCTDRSSVKSMLSPDLNSSNALMEPSYTLESSQGMSGAGGLDGEVGILGDGGGGGGGTTGGRGGGEGGKTGGTDGGGSEGGRIQQCRQCVARPARQRPCGRYPQSGAAGASDPGGGVPLLAHTR